MNPTFRRTLLAGALLLTAPLLCAEEKALPQTPIHFESDSLEYQEASQVIVASGNVKVQQSSYTFYSDYAHFDVADNSLSAWGRVRFEDLKNNIIRAESMRYNMKTGSALLSETEGAFGPWIFGAKEVTRDNEGNFTLKKARLSTCDMDLDKYHVYGYRIKVMPGKRLTVLHALFRLGPVPVAYMPYYYYSLGEKHLAFQLFPGQSRSEGGYLRTVFGYATTEETYVKLYLDYLSLRGTGTGTEFDYYNADKIKGSIYGYRIKDRVFSKERWNARLYHWQAITPGLMLQANINQLSDSSFPNDFFREDFYRVVKDFKSSAAMTYQKGINYFRVTGERTDVFTSSDPATGEFVAHEMLSPKIEFQQLQSPLGVFGLEKIVSANLSNRFSGDTSSGTLPRSYRRESEAQFSVLKRLRLTRTSTLVPKVSIRNRWIDRLQSYETTNNFVQLLDGEAAFRQRAGRYVDLDFAYKISRRLQDNLGDERGIENHTLSFLSNIYPTDALTMRFGTAHRLPIPREAALMFLNRHNYDPLSAEVSYNPRLGLEFFFREEYILADSLSGNAHPLSTQSEAVFGERNMGKDYFLFGTSYFSSKEGAFELRTQGRISLWDRLKLEGTLRTLFSYENLEAWRIRKADFTEKEIRASTDIRCWDIGVVFREHAGVVEFLFNIEMRFDEVKKERNTRAVKDAEFYPWRGMQ